jgi:hypothetical protein
MNTTAAEMRAKLLARLRGQQVRLADQHGESNHHPYSPAAMLQGLRCKIRRSGEDGISNLLGNTFLEPRNPFEPNQRRHTKREVIAAVLECALLLAVWFYYNIR